MKKCIWGILPLLLFSVACSKDDDKEIVPDNNTGTSPETAALVTPRVAVYVDDPEGNQIEMTGILEIFPCIENTAFYFGNYVNKKLGPFNGFYPLENGEILDQYYRQLSLPEGEYNMVYWGTPVYNEPEYSNPAIVTPSVSIGSDMSALYLQLRANRDSTYAPVYDIVHAVKEADITYEDLSVALTRVVAGVKVSVTMNDSSTFSPNIASMEVRIGSIAEKINYYTAQAENKTKTVKFGLVRSDDGKKMSNATVMLFPSAANPLFELRITMQDGTLHTLSQNLGSTLSANTRLTLNIVMGDIIVGETSGHFTIEEWEEASETIEFPVAY